MIVRYEKDIYQPKQVVYQPHQGADRSDQGIYQSRFDIYGLEQGICVMQWVAYEAEQGD